MSTKKVKKILAILLILLIAIIILILLLIKNVKQRYTAETNKDIVVIEQTLKQVNIRNNFYAVKNCINKFYTYYSLMYDLEQDILVFDDETIASMEKQKKQYIEAIYNMLDEEYIKYKNITLENLDTKLNKIEKTKISINNMYVIQKDENISIYFAYGKLTNTSIAQSVDFSMMVKVDMRNETFSVLMQDYIEDNYGEIKIGDNLEVICSKNIKNNGYNTFDFETVDDETYIRDVFNEFRDNMIYNKQVAYENLDKEYRNKRFPNIEDFTKYVQNNIREISIMKLSAYQKNKTENGIQYVCIDTKDNYYIINESSTMNCSFILDTYTIDLPEFIEKYKNSDDSNKVALNIEKLKEAINAKDYLYFYNKMDKTFKNNKYKNYSDLENYLKTNLFEENKFEYGKIEKKSNVYVATLIVKNKKNIAETKEIEIIMKLTDTIDYYISFNLKK